MEQAMRGRFWCGACLEKHSIVFQQIMADFLCGWRWWRSHTFVSYDSVMRSSLTTHCHVILHVLLLGRFLCKFHGFQKVLCLLLWINHFDKSQHLFAKFKRLFPGRFHIFCTPAGLPQLQGWFIYLLKIFDNHARCWSWPHSQTDKKK